MDADESKAEYINKMGANLGEVYHHLWQAIASVHSKWDEYVELFGTKPSRVDLMNDAAPRFFRSIQDSLWEDVLIHIARVTDPAQSAGKQTLTIRRLPDLADSAILGDLNLSIAAARAACEFSRDWRNRRIAHNDLDLITKATAIPLTPTSRNDVTLALESLVKVLDVVSKHYTGSTNMFTWGGDGAAEGAVALLHVLRDGVRARDERFARWERGEIDARDMPSNDDV